MYARKSEDNLQESVFYFSCVDLGNQTRTVRLYWRVPLLDVPSPRLSTLHVEMEIFTEPSTPSVQELKSKLQASFRVHFLPARFQVALITVLFDSGSEDPDPGPHTCTVSSNPISISSLPVTSKNLKIKIWEIQEMLHPKISSLKHNFQEQTTNLRKKYVHKSQNAIFHILIECLQKMFQYLMERSLKCS